MSDLPPPVLPDAKGSPPAAPDLPPPTAPMPPEVPPPSSAPSPPEVPDETSPKGPSMDPASANATQIGKDMLQKFMAAASSKSPEIPGDDSVRPANKSDNSLGILMHLLPTLGLLFIHVPFLNVLPPLGLWLYLRSDNSYLNEHGKEVVNFSLGVGLASLLGYLVCGCLNPFVAIAAGVMAVVGAVKATEGKLYRYPFTLRLIK